MRKSLFLLLGFLWSGLAFAKPTLPKDLLIKLENPEAVTEFAMMAQDGGAKIETIGTGHWLRVILSNQQLQELTLEQLRANPNVLYVQPNYPVRLPEDYRVKNPALRKRLEALAQRRGAKLVAPADNPEIPRNGSGGSGDDPLYAKQWGMNDIGAKGGWSQGRGQGVIVAVIDTGVDYTHEDIVDNLWRNPGETGMDTQGRDKAKNGVDDDGNGFIDDTIGWDFASNDNKPYDLSVDPIEIITKGGNPGHGTHCAGNVGARATNGKGIGGVAPETRIMPIRFLTEKGEGTTADAIKAIDYAVKMGAKVLSNSWGSEGEDPNEGAENQALRDSVQRAQDAGVLFIAAAGNGHQGVGYDNDSDAKPGVPASYPHDNIISVAAINNMNQLGAFSNWGMKSVDIAAPGVAVFSTMVANKYSDLVVDIFGIKVTWDGTSMATPHVAGAAALYWAAHPNATWREVKAAILNSAQPVAALNGKIVTGGKLNITNLLKH